MKKYQSCISINPSLYFGLMNFGKSFDDSLCFIDTYCIKSSVQDVFCEIVVKWCYRWSWIGKEWIKQCSCTTNTSTKVVFWFSKFRQYMIIRLYYYVKFLSEFHTSFNVVSNIFFTLCDIHFMNTGCQVELRPWNCPPQ